MRITLLGTGTPEPSLTRQSSGLLIDLGNDRLVVDHGPGAHHRLLEAGYRAVDVSAAFFTHLHYDHCMDYGRLVLQRWDQGAGAIPDLEVYGPAPIGRLSERLFGRDGAYGPDIDARVHHQSSLDVLVARGGSPPRQPPRPKITEIRAGDVLPGRGWQVRVGHAQHVQPYLECLAFRLDSADGSICYSGDSGLCDEIVDLARGCDVLIQMNHYFSGREPSAAYRAACGNHRDNAEAARRAGVKVLVLTHITPELDRPGVRDGILAEMAAAFAGVTVWGDDLMTIDIARSGIRIGDRAGAIAVARVGAIE